MFFARATDLVAAMYALLFARIRMIQSSWPEISYGPLCKWDEERQKNLDLFYNYNMLSVEGINKGYPHRCT